MISVRNRVVRLGTLWGDEMLQKKQGAQQMWGAVVAKSEVEWSLRQYGAAAAQIVTKCSKKYRRKSLAVCTFLHGKGPLKQLCAHLLLAQ